MKLKIADYQFGTKVADNQNGTQYSILPILNTI